MALKKTSDPVAAPTVQVDAKMRKEAEEQRRKARTLARQQQAAERVASRKPSGCDANIGRPGCAAGACRRNHG